LIARWRFLEADRQYHAATAAHPELANCALRRHAEELDKIVEKLLSTVPDNFKDVTALMKFAIEMLITTLGSVLSDDKNTPALRMLKNVSAGLTKSEAKLRVDAIFREMHALEDARKEFLKIGA
jgi:hypothetical protein